MMIVWQYDDWWWQYDNILTILWWYAGLFLNWSLFLFPQAVAPDLWFYCILQSDIKTPWWQNFYMMMKIWQYYDDSMTILWQYYAGLYLNLGLFLFPRAVAPDPWFYCILQSDSQQQIGGAAAANKMPSIQQKQQRKLNAHNSTKKTMKTLQNFTFTSRF